VNRILASGGLTHYGRFANLGVNYLVDNGGDMHPLIVDPGVVVEFTPNSSMFFLDPLRMVAKGLPGAPITFTSGGGQWGSIMYAHNGNEARFDECVFRRVRPAVPRLRTQPRRLQRGREDRLRRHQPVRGLAIELTGRAAPASRRPAPI
jgi:hypothetical protein